MEKSPALAMEKSPALRDVIILCETKRQLERCKQRLMKVLQERRLRLSSKKTRIGAIDKAFHFLGINYSGPQSWNGINNPLAQMKGVRKSQHEQYLASMGGGEQFSRNQLISA